jgi:hypothetical protein
VFPTLAARFWPADNSHAYELRINRIREHGFSPFIQCKRNAATGTMAIARSHTDTAQ